MALRHILTDSRAFEEYQTLYEGSAQEKEVIELKIEEVENKIAQSQLTKDERLTISTMRSKDNNKKGARST